VRETIAFYCPSYTIFLIKIAREVSYHVKLLGAPPVPRPLPGGEVVEQQFARINGFELSGAVQELGDRASDVRTACLSASLKVRLWSDNDDTLDPPTHHTVR
jgi:hypothetical protein